MPAPHSTTTHGSKSRLACTSHGQITELTQRRGHLATTQEDLGQAGGHGRKQLNLARGHTRTKAKAALGHHEHPPETGCPSKAFRFPSELYLGYNCWPEGEGRRAQRYPVKAMLVRERGWAGLLLSQCSNSPGTGGPTTGSSPGHPA